jgi:hypothetical protein
MKNRQWTKLEDLKSSQFGSAPVYDKYIFMDKEKEQEWEELDPSTKKFLMRNLRETTSRLECKMAIETLCLAMNDMFKRLETLERH